MPQRLGCVVALPQRTTAGLFKHYPSKSTRSSILTLLDLVLLGLIWLDLTFDVSPKRFVVSEIFPQRTAMTADFGTQAYSLLAILAFLLMVVVTGGIVYLTLVEWRDRRRIEREQKGSKPAAKRRR